MRKFHLVICVIEVCLFVFFYKPLELHSNVIKKSSIIQLVFGHQIFYNNQVYTKTIQIKQNYRLGSVIHFWQNKVTLMLRKITLLQLASTCWDIICPTTQYQLLALSSRTQFELRRYFNCWKFSVEPMLDKCQQANNY